MSAMIPSSQSYSIPRERRGRKSLFQVVHGAVALCFYLTGCIIVVITLAVFSFPLRVIPSKRAHALHFEGIRYGKGAFGVLVTLLSQLFAPTSFRVTFESEGPGAFTNEQVEEMVVRDANGRVTELRLPNKLVIVANHQNSTDWLYIWSLTYFMNMHTDVLIVLKNSLKWIPILGWGMQMFRFIFLARSFAADKSYLVGNLAKVGRRAEENNNPLAFLIYPEGTVCDGPGRAISKKYAEKMAIPDMTHTLLPRSTGLLYSLRALSPRLPDLKLLDVTVAYGGVPAMGYSKDYYIIPSVFMDRVPPPVVHMHLRLFDVASTVPIGDLSNAPVTPPGSSTDFFKPPPPNSALSASNGQSATSQGIDVPEHERLEFDRWLTELWRIKDKTIDAFHRSAPGVEKSDLAYSTNEEAKVFASTLPAQVIPIKVRSLVEALHPFGFFWPVIAYKGWKRL